MRSEDLVQLAEQYCKHFHKTQKRKGGNQAPYHTHPHEVRDILVKYGYDSCETQAIALLHDTIEDTELGEYKSEIDKRFGPVIYHGVYILSNNTVGKYAEKLATLFKSLGVDYLQNNKKITPEAYKLRILFARDSVKCIKIADVIHNTQTLRDLNKAGIERKIKDAETFYVPLGKSVAPLMIQELIKNIENYKKSDHYKEMFG